MKEEREYKFEMMAEILPDNERTAEIMKKRAEDEEVRRQKAEELKAMKTMNSGKEETAATTTV